jgi:hypothetical protein
MPHRNRGWLPAGDKVADRLDDLTPAPPFAPVRHLLVFGYSVESVIRRFPREVM